MNSAKTLNYETRPVKFTERKMILASISKLVSQFGGDYQYIGFGGLTFTDFKLFHNELHLREMYSIEGGDVSIEKLNFNKPFGFINVIPHLSTVALTNGSIDLTKKSLVWMDYDDCLENFFFDDITALFSKLPVGSIYIVTCNRQLDNKKSGVPYSVDDFIENFGSNTPFDIQSKELNRKNSYKGIRRALKLHLENILKQRSNSEGIVYDFNQLYNILYNENRGAEMYTYGGVITTNTSTIQEINLSEFDFIRRDDDTYNLVLPNFTRKEIDLVNVHIHGEEKELVDRKIIDQSELDIYKSIYKYMPYFLDVRV
ncbi:O-methyltransferase [Sphingobacterium sp. SG20118]|uniref:O-methyltransferase n=1 Tax=Sphingobacterium sp. SG20118 TaxID=3367156 RepID=UPI0037DFC037